LNNNSKQHLHTQEWPCPNPKAILLLVHGLGEHIGRYAHLAAYFNQHGIAVLGFDHPGHGQTPGKRGHVKNMEALMEGVAVMLTEAKSRYPDLPVYLYGHSMGGNITLNYILRKQPEVAGAIISAPHISMVTEPTALLVAMGRLVQKIYPTGTQSNGLNVMHLSRDKTVVQRYIDDPLVHDRISYSLAVALIDGAKWLNAYQGPIPIPILLMHGAADGITSAAASKAFAERNSAYAGAVNHITNKEWPDLYHEIHNEAEKEKVFNFALDWILNR
jgi:alpha-beta hydrolase superfamily lysophospholipase